MNIDALYNLTHGVYVLGADDGGRPVGSAVDAVMQVASKPVAAGSILSSSRISASGPAAPPTNGQKCRILSKTVCPICRTASR